MKKNKNLEQNLYPYSSFTRSAFRLFLLLLLLLLLLQQLLDLFPGQVLPVHKPLHPLLLLLPHPHHQVHPELPVPRPRTTAACRFQTLKHVVGDCEGYQEEGKRSEG